MWWWCPIQFNLSEGAWGIVGVIIGALIGYAFDIRRRMEEEKKRKLEKVKVLHAQYEGLAMRLLQTARNVHSFNFSYMQASRKKTKWKTEGKDKGEAWVRLVEETKELTLLYINASDKYNELMGNMHALMKEFGHYLLEDGVKFDNKNLRHYKIDRYTYLSNISDEEFNRLDMNQVSMDIHDKFHRELNSCLSPIIKIMTDRIEEMKKGIQ